MLLYLQIPTYRTPNYKKVSSKLSTSDPTPSVHHPRNNIDELLCDEVIHYHSRYRHCGPRRPHSAPGRPLSREAPLHPFPHSASNASNSSKHFSLGQDQKSCTESHTTESSPKITTENK